MLEDYMCDICRENPAKIVLAQVLGNEKKTSRVCSDCWNIINEKMNTLLEMLPQAELRTIPGMAPPPPAIPLAAKPGSIPAYIQKSLGVNFYAENKANALMPEPVHVLPPERLTSTCHCGLNLNDFLLQKFPGCPTCFYTWKDDISGYLDVLRQRETTAAETSKKKGSNEDKIRKLEKEKREAVEKQEFARAAAIRDEIRKLQEAKARRTKNDNEQDSN